MTRLVFGWCALYTLAVPAEDRARRREELAAHVWEAGQTWGSGLRSRVRILVGCARGMLHDVAWCNDVRNARGLSPLVLAAVGPTGGTFIAGVLIATAYALSHTQHPVTDSVRNVVELVALVVMVASLALRFRGWRNSRGR